MVCEAVAAPQVPAVVDKPRVPAIVATAIVLAALVSVNFAEHVLRGADWLGPVAAVALLAFARWSGLSWSQLGLHRNRLRSGLRWGLSAVALVAAVYLVGVFIPLTRTAFLDARYHLGLQGALVSAFVVIPLSTILLEEVAFRSVLWGMLARHVTTWRVLLTSSAVVYGRVSEAVDEDAPCAPVSNYGHAKLAMEQAVAQRLREMGPDAPPCCILRIGNVAGVDSLLEAAARGPVSLDQFSDGHGPVRSYIGMQTLAQIMLQLIGLAAGGAILPPVLNIAAPQPVHLADLLRATRANWSWRAAPAEALPQVVLDTRRLAALVLPDPLSPDPAELVRQARLAGWAPQ